MKLPPINPGNTQTSTTQAVSSQATSQGATSTAQAQYASLNQLQLKPNQTYAAQVLNQLGTTNSQPATNLWELSVNGKITQIHSRLALEAGMQLSVSGSSASGGGLTIHSPLLPTAPNLVLIQLLGSFRDSLPKQETLQNVFGDLSKIVNAPKTAENNFTTLQASVSQLLKNHSIGKTGENSTLSGLSQSLSNIKNLMQQGGTRFESSLIRYPELSKSYRQPIEQSLQQGQANSSSNQAQSSTRAADPTTAVLRELASLIARQNTGSSTTQNIDKVGIDLKGALLQVHGQLTELSKTKSASSDPSQLSSVQKPSIDALPLPQLNQLITQSQGDNEQLTIGKLLKLVASALHRIHSNQLTSLVQSQTASADGTPTQVLNFEIPVQVAEHQYKQLELTLESYQEETSNNENEETEQTPVWKLLLTFDLDQHGKIYIQTKLSPPAITATTWAESASGHQLILKEREQFLDRLRSLGLEISEIESFHGKPVLRSHALSQQLIDTNV